MIQWAFNITHGEFDNAVKFSPSSNQTLQVNETDVIEIEVVIGESYFKFGDPYILIGDVPIELVLNHSDERYNQYVTIKDNNFNKNQLFYNYFGESEIKLKFRDNHDVLEKIKVDVKARKANAVLAQTMLKYISDNATDLVSLCFSKSFTGGDFDDKNKDNMHKFSLLRDTITSFYGKLGLFYRDYRYTLESSLHISQQGQPIGPDSVYWLLQNLDKIMPSNAEEAKLRIKNRTYTSTEIPTEIISQNTDVFENRVIKSFFYSARQFLVDLKRKYKYSSDINTSEKIKTDGSDEFVSFDHTLLSFKRNIIKHHIEDINSVLLMVDKVIHLNKVKLEAKLVPQLRPKITPFVMQRPHYRELFFAIDKWYNASSPNLEQNNILLGLRNLSSIYEMTTLLMLSKDIPNTFDVKLNEQKYRKYGDNLSFEGEVVDRPIDQINNYFNFESGKLSVELLFEPRIYSYRKGVSKENDIINISNRRATEYGEHYYLPDYIVRINYRDWKEPLIIILDAKYSDRRNVLKYSLKETSDKYLHNLFQLKKGNEIGTSPVKLMMILFAHGEDLPASFLHKQHHVDGELPAYPQGVGIKYTPTERGRASDWLNKCFDYHNKVQSGYSNALS
jgi:hypothetical protein